MELLPNTKILKEMLEKIGFSLRNCGCDFHRIMNKKNRYTGFEVFDDRITVRSGDTDVFGGYGRGGIGFNLRDCVIEYDKELHFVSVHAKEVPSVFILFYGK